MVCVVNRKSVPSFLARQSGRFTSFLRTSAFPATFNCLRKLQRSVKTSNTNVSRLKIHRHLSSTIKIKNMKRKCTYGFKGHFLQDKVAFIVFMSLLSMNIIRQFSGTARKMAVVAPALFVNHGGGPLPLLGDKDHAELTKFLRDGIKKHVNLKDIKAIILVTAHWEENKVTISSGNQHDLYFDYYGFPPESYLYKYEAPGDPQLAKRLHETLKENGIDSKLDPKRGWDHGVFVPMMLINPSADIPIIQISVLRSQDPEQHYKLGQVLHQFRKEGIAVIGSGMSYHNMRQFMTSRGLNKVINAEFDYFLNKACMAEDDDVRKKSLLSWREQPGATDAHPMGAAEHFMPLIVVAGAGGQEAGERIFQWDMSGTFRLSGFIWKNL